MAWGILRHWQRFADSILKAAGQVAFVQTIGPLLVVLSLWEAELARRIFPDVWCVQRLQGPTNYLRDPFSTWERLTISNVLCESRALSDPCQIKKLYKKYIEACAVHVLKTSSIQRSSFLFLFAFAILWTFALVVFFGMLRTGVRSWWVWCFPFSSWYSCWTMPLQSWRWGLPPQVSPAML